MQQKGHSTLQMLNNCPIADVRLVSGVTRGVEKQLNQFTCTSLLTVAHQCFLETHLERCHILWEFGSKEVEGSSTAAGH